MNQSLALGALIAAMAVAVAPVRAQTARIYVSAVSGVDNAGCGAQVAPCRTFQFAHDNTPSGGQVQVGSPGDYGPVTITKSLSIVNDGVGTAGVLSGANPTTAGVVVDAGVSDRVYLRGLAFDNRNTNLAGVLMNAGAFLKVEKCTFQGGTNGVQVGTPGVTSFVVSDSIFSGNFTGVLVTPREGGTTTGVIERVTVVNQSRIGIQIVDDGANASPAPSQVTIVDSVVGNATEEGVFAQSVTRRVVLDIRRAVVANTVPSLGAANGYAAIGKIDMRLAHSVATGNLVGVYGVGFSLPAVPSIRSYADNNLLGNASGTTDLVGGASFNSIATQ